MSARLTALEQRFTDHETRFQQRLVDQEMRTKSLESKVDEGFAKVLARLSTLQTGAQASDVNRVRSLLSTHEPR